MEVTVQRQSYSNNELLKASLFFAGLVITLIVCVTMAFASAPPIILGTEMNTNGVVEYLCLGNGCENLTAMDW